MIESLKKYPKDKVISAFEDLSDKEANLLLTDWKLWARKEQLPPEKYWEIWLILTGRGWGKTRTGAEWVLQRVREGYKRIALIGQTKADVRDTMIEVGDSAILNIASPDLIPEYVPSNRRLTWNKGKKNEAIAIIYSGDEPSQLRGPQHDTAWVDELAKFKYPQETWDNLELGLRLSLDPKICVTTTPRPIPIIKKLIKEKNTVVVRGNTYENIENLPKVFVSRIKDKYENTRIGRQELKGEILEEVQGALWNLNLIDKYRVNEIPDLKRIVIAIDPEATSTKDSAETGIIGAGLGIDGHGYILNDRSLRARPDVWGSQAIKLYNELKASRIIAEINNGGEMVESVLRTIEESISYKAIHASKGKLTRAEPISALYEQGKVHHVGVFAELEDQMCNWIPGEKSPDRMDALVWALTELMLGNEIIFSVY